jgi:1,4-dihydroxy-2-naphthoate octaprenyltransferase
MSNSSIKTNSLRAWILAARPKTLTGASVPVAIGLAWVYADAPEFFLVFPAVLCFLFAFVMQIDANLINDFFDYVKGTDDESRLGPKRACAEGWISLDAMKRGIALTTVLACVIGLPLVYWGGLEMLLIGVLCVIFCFLYTTHLSYLGLGDWLVIVFFGLVPVCITYYIQLHTCSLDVLMSSLGCGLVIDTLLVVNNFRDRDTDLVAGKHTLITKLGERKSSYLYLFLGIVAVLMNVIFLFDRHYFAFLLPCLYLVPHIFTYRRMVSINKGRELNKVLGMTARNIFIYGVLSVVGLLIS